MFEQSDQNLKYDTYIEKLKAQGFFLTLAMNSLKK